MPQDELTPEQKEEIAPILNVLEDHYLKLRKPQVDKLQEIERQIELFQGNALVLSGLEIIREQAQLCIQNIDDCHKQNARYFEINLKRLYSISEGYYWR